jgi:hypothetical protein
MKIFPQDPQEPVESGVRGGESQSAETGGGETLEDGLVGLAYNLMRPSVPHGTWQDFKALAAEAQAAAEERDVLRKRVAECEAAVYELLDALEPDPDGEPYCWILDRDPALLNAQKLTAASTQGEANAKPGPGQDLQLPHADAGHDPDVRAHSGSGPSFGGDGDRAVPGQPGAVAGLDEDRGSSDVGECIRGEESTGMSHWIVSTPEYGVTVPILDDGTGPIEYYSDSICVEAPNKRAARVEGVRKLRSLFPKGWLSDHSANPFVGLSVESALCPHGVLVCECSQADYCEECEKEHQKP